jgi:hypothetical protein
MLDGQRYFSEFPDENPEQPPRLVLSDELLVTLAAIEREISAFIQREVDDNPVGVAGNGGPAKDQ